MRDLHLPANQAFECTACGRCCRGGWSVLVDDETCETIHESRLFASKVRAGYTPLIVDAERTILDHQSDGSCVFLDSSNLCELHKELGSTRKPLVCRTYPFLLTDTPSGVYAAVSFACPAILSNVGTCVEQERRNLEAVLAQSPEQASQGRTIEGRVELTEGFQVSWPEYERIESWILGRFEPARPVESLLEIAVQLIHLERTEEGSVVVTLSPRNEIDESSPSLGGFEQELTCMVSSNLIAMLEEIDDVEKRARVGSLLWNQQDYFSERFQKKFPQFSIRRPMNSEIQHLIDRYVRNLVMGKRLLVGGTVLSRILGTACGLAMLLFYVEVFSEPAIEGPPTPEAVDRAFTLIERELLSHTHSFDGFFAEFERALESVRVTLADL